MDYFINPFPLIYFSQPHPPSHENTSHNSPLGKQTCFITWEIGIREELKLK